MLQNRKAKENLRPTEFFVNLYSSHHCIFALFIFLCEPLCVLCGPLCNFFYFTTLKSFTSAFENGNHDNVAFSLVILLYIKPLLPNDRVLAL